jgi:hypothetical protein
MLHSVGASVESCPALIEEGSRRGKRMEGVHEKDEEEKTRHKTSSSQLFHLPLLSNVYDPVGRKFRATIIHAPYVSCLS